MVGQAPPDAARWWNVRQGLTYGAAIVLVNVRQGLTYGDATVLINVRRGLTYDAMVER